MTICHSAKSRSATIHVRKTGYATSTFASSTKTYNAYGLIATSTDRRGYATGYKYDAFNLYVATATNPLNQKTQYTYNYATGKVKQTTDPNTRLAKNIFDGVGRLIEVDQSDATNSAVFATSTTYQFTDNTASPSIIHRADYLTATTTVDTYEYYDGFNRLVQGRKASQTAGTYVPPTVCTTAPVCSLFECAVLLFRLRIHDAILHRCAQYLLHLRSAQAHPDHHQCRRTNQECICEMDDNDDRSERQHQRLRARRLRQPRQCRRARRLARNDDLQLRCRQQSRDDHR